MPLCDSVNETNTPNAYSGIELVDVGVEDDEQHGGGDAQHDDAVRERQPVAAERELVRQEPVARQDRAQSREVGVARVRREDQDERRRRLDRVERPACSPNTVLAICAGAEISSACWTPNWCARIVMPRKNVPRIDAHPHERGRRVARLRLLERGDAVRDRLDAGERGAARRERAQDDEQRQAGRAGRMDRLRDLRAAGPGRCARRTKPPIEQHDDRDDEGVRRDREDRRRLADAAQVQQRDRRRPRRRRSRLDSRMQLRERRRDREHAGRDRHRRP